MEHKQSMNHFYVKILKQVIDYKIFLWVLGE